MFFLSACSHNTIPARNPTLPNNPTIENSDQKIPDYWLIKAKLGIRSPEESGSVRLRWQQKQQNYHVQISGPLGQGKALISGNNRTVLIERPNEEPIYARNVEELMLKTFGWQLPLQNFNYWIRGMVSPLSNIDTISYKRDGQTIRSLQQSSWQLDYLRHTSKNDWLLPTKIRAKHNDSIFTLIIHDWNFADQ